MVTNVEDLDIYKMAEELSNKIWNICIQWNYFPKDTIGKQLFHAANSIFANIAEGRSRYNFRDRLNFYYYAR